MKRDEPLWRSNAGFLPSGAPMAPSGSDPRVVEETARADAAETAEAPSRTGDSGGFANLRLTSGRSAEQVEPEATSGCGIPRPNSGSTMPQFPPTVARYIGNSAQSRRIGRSHA